MDSFCSALLIGIISGAISSVITGFWLLRYSEFLECKNILQQKISIMHLYVFQLGHKSSHEKLMELQSTVLTMSERFYEAGHKKSVAYLGSMISEIIHLDNMITASSIPTLQISDYFKKWIKDINGLSFSWLALLAPFLKKAKICTRF